MDTAHVVPVIDVPQISDEDWRAATETCRSDGGYEKWKAQRAERAAQQGFMTNRVQMIFDSFREGLIEEAEAHRMVDAINLAASMGATFPAGWTACHDGGARGVG